LDITAGWRRAGGAAAAAASAAAAGSAGLRAWVRRVYPWIHAGKEAAVLAFLVLFLFNRTSCSRSSGTRYRISVQISYPGEMQLFRWEGGRERERERERGREGERERERESQPLA
jgi:hypothetical protein